MLLNFDFIATILETVLKQSGREGIESPVTTSIGLGLRS